MDTLLYLIPVALAFTPQMLWFALNLQERIARRNIIVSVPALRLYQQGLASAAFALSISIFFDYPLATAGGVAIAVSAALLSSYIDWKTCRIPNELVIYGFIGSSLLVPLFYNPEGWVNIGITAVVIIVAGVITNILTRGKLGGGDIKLLISFAPALYWFDSLNIFYVLLLALPIQLVARVIWKKSNPDSKGAPYGPALTLSLIILIVIGAATSTPIV
jgi:Flp pilus assembly protein protease CpaA